MVVYLIIFLVLCLIISLATLFFYILRVEKQKMYIAVLKESIASTHDSVDAMKNAFESLSLTALEKNNTMFLQLASQSFETLEAKGVKHIDAKHDQIHLLVKPLQERLKALDDYIIGFESNRKKEHGEMRVYLDALKESEKEIADKTRLLSKALSTPHIRGQWGEMQLKKALELAGLLPHADFNEQVSVDSHEGALRPDVVVSLAGGGNVIIDSKAPLTALLKVYESESLEHKNKYKLQHVKAVKDHIKALSKKKYYEYIPHSFDIVILFLPHESALHVALQEDATLLDEASKSNVVLATPTSIIGILKTIQYGWKEQHMAENAEKIKSLGKELYKRIIDVVKYVDAVGKSFDTTVTHYNKLVGSLSLRLIPKAKQFKSLSGEQLEEPITPRQVESLPRQSRVSED